MTFGSADIKALLTYAMHLAGGSGQHFLGRRCEVDYAQLRSDLRAGRMDQSTYDRRLNDVACRDTNAGSFHMVLANELGLKAQGFIADVTEDQEVWNQGLVGYQSRIGDLREGASTGAAAGTKFEAEVETDIDYLREIPSSWVPTGSSAAAMHGHIKYRYRLELNAQGEIIGGAWLGDRHPDFLWTMPRAAVSAKLALLPAIYQAATGDVFGGGTGPAEPRRPSPPHNPSGAPLSPGRDCIPNDPFCFP